MSREVILNTVRELFEKTGFAVEVSWEEPSRVVVMTSDDRTGLTSRDGQNVVALEQVARLMVLKRLHGAGERHEFTLDVNNYRKERDQKLTLLAQESANRVVSTGVAESLAPMNSYERKVVHTALASYTDLATQSIGSEPNRRVVIKRASF